jgi:tryptophan synthase alpha subunit
MLGFAVHLKIGFGIHQKEAVRRATAAADAGDLC